MTTLMIVARDSMVSELEQLLHDNGIDAYSMLNRVGGKGKSGAVYESLLHKGSVGFNIMILAVVSSDHGDKAISALKAFHTKRLKEARGNPIPLKLFVFPCEEVI